MSKQNGPTNRHGPDRPRPAARLRFTLVSILGVAVSCAGLLGCHFRSGSQTSNPETVFIKGRTNWLHLAQLRKVADAAVQRNGATVSDGDIEVTAHVFRHRDTNFLTFFYFRGFGLRADQVTFDSSGTVVAVTNWVARE